MLLKSTADIKKYIAIDKNMHFDTVKPYFETAEQTVAELLGEEIYTALKAEVLTEPFEALLPYVCRPIANYGMLLYIDSCGLANINDTGIQQQNSSNSMPAPQWVVIKIETSLMNTGDKAVDRLLLFLENNIATYPAWAATKSYSLLKESFLKNAAEATRFININNSRRVFIQLKSHINYVEDVIIRQTIGEEQYNQLKDQIKTGLLSQDNTLLVEKIKPIVAVQALKGAIPQMKYKITDNGINVSSFGGLGYVFGKIENSATAQETNALIKDLSEKAQNYTDHLKMWLQKNIDKFPLYAASEANTLRAVPGPRHQVENSADSKSFWV